ncbi:MAG: cupin domain-containing protein [Agriterribacter sp.]
MKKIISSKHLDEFYTPEKCFIAEVLNTEEYNFFSVAKARVEPGIITELHTLKDTDEAYYILSGKGEMEIDSETVGIAEANDIVFIPRNSTQRIKNIANEDLIFLCICAPRFIPENYFMNKE